MHLSTHLFTVHSLTSAAESYHFQLLDKNCSIISLQYYGTTQYYTAFFTDLVAWSVCRLVGLSR